MSRVRDVCAFSGQVNEMKISPRSDTPDLHTQLESLLDQVWRSESDWRLWDRVDAAVTLEAFRARRAQGADADKKRAANREAERPR
jgi:hypothetical protein